MVIRVNVKIESRILPSQNIKSSYKTGQKYIYKKNCVPSTTLFWYFYQYLLHFKGKSFLIGKDSMSCHEVTALVYSPASISVPEGLAVTCWHHFIHLVENERRVPCSFMILSHLARFLALLVCLTPRAWKIENVLLCSPSSLSVSLCLYVCNKHLHENICLHTKIYLCVGVVTRKCLLFALKKNTQTAVPVISKPISNTVYLFPVSLSWTERSAMCTLSQETRGEGRLQV